MQYIALIYWNLEWLSRPDLVMLPIVVGFARSRELAREPGNDVVTGGWLAMVVSCSLCGERNGVDSGYYSAVSNPIPTSSLASVLPPEPMLAVDRRDSKLAKLSVWMLKSSCDEAEV